MKTCPEPDRLSHLDKVDNDSNEVGLKVGEWRRSSLFKLWVKIASFVPTVNRRFLDENTLQKVVYCLCSGT